MTPYDQKIWFLRGYAKAKGNAYALAAQISDLEEMQLPNGVHYTDMPKHHSYEDQMARFGAEYWELTKKLEKAEKRMMRVIAVINQLQDTDPDGCTLLTLQYVKQYRRQEIELEMHISSTTRKRWHRRAVERLTL